MTTAHFLAFVVVVVFAAIVLFWDYIIDRPRKPAERASDYVAEAEEDGWPHRGTRR